MTPPRSRSRGGASSLATALGLTLFLAAHAASAQAAPPRNARPETRAADEDDDRLFHLGPQVGVGVPNLLNFGLTAKLTRYVGFGVNVGIIPTVKLSLYGEAKLAYQEYDAYLRVYPFGGGFFLGSGIGYESIRASFTQSLAIPDVPGVISAQTVSVQSEATVRSLVLTPQIGYLHRFASGFSLGVDVGAQVPISASDISFGATLPPGIPAAYTTPVTDPIQTTLRSIGQQVVPTLDVRMGWMF